MRCWQARGDRTHAYIFSETCRKVRYIFPNLQIRTCFIAQTGMYVAAGNGTISRIKARFSAPFVAAERLLLNDGVLNPNFICVTYIFCIGNCIGVTFPSISLCVPVIFKKSLLISPFIIHNPKISSLKSKVKVSPFNIYFP